MIGGFALVAYPAQYGVSGVMTFIVNQDGVVYQKDLGPNSAAIATGDEGVQSRQHVDEALSARMGPSARCGFGAASRPSTRNTAR